MEKTSENLITQLKLNATLQNNINNELERKVKERTEQLDTFIYRASHDIRGPLRSISGLAQIGIMETKTFSEREIFNHILTTTSKLDATLYDLLEIIRLNHNSHKNENIDFKILLDKIIESFAFQYDMNLFKIDVEIDELKDYKSDKVAVQSILQNLFENGLKYRDVKKSNSYLKIRIQRRKDFIELRFEDNGIGIDKKEKEKIFQMFYKVSSNSHGTGLGLYIVQLSVKKLGGTIELYSDVNKGSCFTILLPYTE